MTSIKKREEIKFFIFISPWLIGFLAFFIIPAGTSLVYSFTDYNAIQPPNWIGLQNYSKLLKDQIFIKSLQNTLFFVLFGVPVNTIFQILVATLLDSKVRGIGIFRTLYYLPYLVPMIATTIIWRLLFNTDFGVINGILSALGIPKVRWMDIPALIKPQIVLMAMWASGSGILIFLAALKGVPSQLYESAKIDGAGAVRIYFKITIPMISPAILFSVVMQMISNFQMFTETYLYNRGGPNYASITYMLNTYNTAFRDFQFGKAMAQSWILFMFIAIFTAFVLSAAKRWVYYEGEGQR